MVEGVGGWWSLVGGGVVVGGGFGGGCGEGEMPGGLLVVGEWGGELLEWW